MPHSPSSHPGAAGLRTLGLALALCAAGPAMAQVAEPATPLARILERPLPSCTDGAFGLLARQMRADAPRVVVDAMRRMQSLGDAWAPGDPTYDRVRSMVATAFDTYEKANGPLAPTGYREARQQFFQDRRPEILALLADVFDRPGGRLYWDTILGGAECTAVLEAILPSELSPADRFSYDRFRHQSQTAYSAFGAGLPGLSPADRKDFDAARQQMQGGIIGGPAHAAALVGAPLQANARKALAPLQTYLRGALESWRAEHPPAPAP